MIRIICIGKLKEKYLVNMIEDYLKRINKYHKIEQIELKDDSKKEEGERILSKLNTRSLKVALTLDGQKFNSPSFSNFTNICTEYFPSSW